jgi:hypothetical protein
VALTFLTPLAAIFAVSVLVPLGVFWSRERRARRIRTDLGLEQPRLRSRLPLVVAIAAVPVLLGMAAAQPVIEQDRSVPERVDAQAFFVIDISRSMLASADAGSETRFQRARRVAAQLRARIPEVPAGIASMTDRLLPHAFPTTDQRVFAATLRKSVDIERPPPNGVYSTQATTFEVLADIPEQRYFSPTAKKRLLVVLTDGESRPFGAGLGRAFGAKPPIETVFVRFWGKDERIYETGVAEGGYVPDPGSAAALQRAASLVGGRTFSEADVQAAGDAIVEAVGTGKTGKRTISGARLALMPWLTLATLLPLGFLLWRRNR